MIINVDNIKKIDQTFNSLIHMAYEMFYIDKIKYVEDNKIKYVSNDYTGHKESDNQVVRDSIDFIYKLKNDAVKQIEDNDYTFNVYRIVKQLYNLNIDEMNIELNNISFVDSCKLIYKFRNNSANMYKEYKGLNNVYIKNSGYLELPFKSSIELHSPFTLKQLLDTLYVMKKNKFDYWHEMYIECKFKEDSIFLDFDYD